MDVFIGVSILSHRILSDKEANNIGVNTEPIPKIIIKWWRNTNNGSTLNVLKRIKPQWHGVVIWGNKNYCWFLQIFVFYLFVNLPIFRLVHTKQNEPFLFSTICLKDILVDERHWEKKKKKTNNALISLQMKFKRNKITIRIVKFKYDIRAQIFLREMVLISD